MFLYNHLSPPKMKLSFMIHALVLMLLVSSIHADDEESVTELKIEILKNGDCSRKAQKGDNLMMHYEGTLLDGKEFDSSYKRGDPLKFQLGAGMVIQGWDEGLEGMCKGEIRNLLIPYEKAYGEGGYPPVIPAKAPLKFKVELLDFNPEGDAEDEL